MTQSRKEISVVIATYNGEKYILKQLESIRNQTRKADEVIIVDDRSTDATYRIVMEYINHHTLQNWKLYLNDKNLGYKKNFKKGIELASGKLFFLCDQDDEWEKNKIELMTKVMKDNPQIQALNCGVRLIDGDSKEIEYKQAKNMYNCGFLYSNQPVGQIAYFTYPYLLKHNISPGCTMVITQKLRSDFLDTYKYDLPHDWHLNLLASVDFGCAFYNRPLVNYRRHSDNAIGANTGFVKGITTRTRKHRIQSCVEKENTSNDILTHYCKKMGGMQQLDVMLHTSELEEVLKWNTTYKDFFESPSFANLINLYKFSEYRETTRTHIRMWNVVVAFRLDDIVIKLVIQKKGKSET